MRSFFLKKNLGATLKPQVARRVTWIIDWIVSIPLCMYTKFFIKSTVFTQHILLANV